MELLCAKRFFGIRTANQVKNFTTIRKGNNNTAIRYCSNWLIRNNTEGKFITIELYLLTALHPALSYQTTFYESKVDHLLLANFFHEKANKNFVGKLKFVRRLDQQPQFFFEYKNIGRALYL